MNPNIAVTGSVISKSPMTRFAVALAMLTSLFGMFTGQSLAAAMVSSVIGFTLGGSVKRYKTWEGGSLVPGMHQAMARVAIQISLCLWVVLIFAAVGIEGSFLVATGMCLLLIAIGLCVGAGDIRLFYITFAAIGFGGFVCYKLAMSRQAFDFLAWFPAFWFELAGSLMVFAGCGFLWRFWNLITRPEEVVSCDGLQKLAPRSIEGKQDDSLWTINRSKPAASNSVRTRKLIEYAPTLRIRDYAWPGLLLAALTGALIRSRGNDDMVMFFQLIALLVLLFVPVASFMTRVPESFERLWVMGIATNRVETLRRKLGLSAWRCIAFLVLVTIGLAIQSPANRLSYATTFSLMLVAFGLGAILLLVASRTYRVWVAHTNAVMLIFAVLCLTLSLAAFFVTNGKADLANSLVSSIGLARSLIFSLLFAVVCWVVCLLDGGRAMANDSALLE